MGLHNEELLNKLFDKSWKSVENNLFCVAGFYQCIPTNTDQAAVVVHVLDGKSFNHDILQSADKILKQLPSKLQYKLHAATATAFKFLRKKRDLGIA